MERYEQYDVVSPRWAWVMVIAFSASLIGWALLMHALVPDEPRRWNFGQLEDTPGESRYSTSEPILRSPVPPQMPTLPEARPFNPGSPAQVQPDAPASSRRTPDTGRRSSP